MAHNNLILHSD